MEGKTALITGGSSGIGLASAKLFQEHGARVAIAGTDAAKLDKAEDGAGRQRRHRQGRCPLVADMTRMADEVKAAFGKLDIFFANAGAAPGTPIGATDEAAYTELMDVNVKGVFFSVQAAVPLMRREARSSSIRHGWIYAAWRGGASLRDQGGGALLTRSLRPNSRPRSIRVNAVSPGSITTPLHKGE